MSKAPQVEVYGFVGYILSFVVFGLYLLWAYLPEHVLQDLGITYYPNKYWAIAVPCWTCVAVVYGVIVYVCITFIRNPSLDSKHAYTDELAEGNSARGDLYIFDGNGVPPIADIPLSHVNYLQCLHLPAKDSQING